MDSTLQLVQAGQHSDARQTGQSKFYATLVEMMESCRVPIFSGTSEASATEIEACNAVFSQISREARDAFEYIQKKLNSCVEGCFTDVLQAVEGFNLDKLQLAQRVVQQRAVAVELSAKQELELRPLHAPLLAEAEEILVEVKEALTALGSGVESQVGYRSNPAVAEKQFDFHCRRGNLRCRAAFEKARIALEEYKAAAADVAIKKSGLEKANAILRKMAIDAVNR